MLTPTEYLSKNVCLRQKGGAGKKTVGTTRLPTLSNNPFAGFCEALIDYPFHRQISAPQTISKQKHHTITICNVWPTHIHPWNP